MLTAIILTKNSQKYLTKCLHSLSFCKQILVIDDYSSDKTVSVARLYKAKVIRHKLHNFASQRNFALTKVATPWALFIDADEKICQKLAEEIQRAITSEKFSGYLLKRVDYFLG